MPMHALVKFLEFPLHGWARFRFGLGAARGRRHPGARERALRDRASRGDAPLAWRAARREAPGRFAGGCLRRGCARQGAPGVRPFGGVCSRGERTLDHVEALRTWRSELEKQSRVPIESLAVHRFGRAGERADGEEVHEPLSIELDVLDRRSTTRASCVARSSAALFPFGGGEADAASITLAKRVADAEDGEWDVAGAQANRFALLRRSCSCGAPLATAERSARR